MRDTLRGAALVYGLLVAVFSLLAALLLAILAVLGDGALRLAPLTILVSVAALGVGLGLPLAAAAWRSWQRRPSPALRLPPAWWLVLIFLGVLALGQLLLPGPAVRRASVFGWRRQRQRQLSALDRRRVARDGHAARVDGELVQPAAPPQFQGQRV